MNVENKHNNKLERLGFSYERGGVHTARTMMLTELHALLSYVYAADAAKADYLEAIQTANCLGKHSSKTRTLTFRHLADLYALDPSLLLIHALRFFWQRDVDGLKLTPFHGHLIVLTEGVRDAQSQTAVRGAIGAGTARTGIPGTGQHHGRRVSPSR